MKIKVRVVLLAVGYLLSAVLSGCSTVKEAGKGFVGISTQVLEQGRKDSLKKSFVLDYDRCYLKVKDILSQKGQEAYIYAEVPKEKLIAIYFSAADTTPVGIFFTMSAQGITLIEISSPSIYAKEEIANRIFTGLEELTKPKNQEKKADVKK